MSISLHLHGDSSTEQKGLQYSITREMEYCWEMEWLPSHDASQAAERPNPGEEGSPPAASHQAGDGEGGNGNPSMDDE